MHSRSMKRAVSIILLAIFAMLGIAPAALASIPAQVTTSTLVYQSVSPNAARVQVPQGLQVNITAVRSGWAQVTYRSYVGYMPLNCLTPSARVPGYATCAADVYSVSGVRMGTVPQGTCVYVLGTISGGYLVMNSSGTMGLMKNGTLTNQPPQAAPAPAPVSGVDKALQLAQYLLGRPYSLYSNPPSSFNCSSFVQYCMAYGGYSMKGTAYDQAADGRYQLVTSLSSLRKGDVLCFDTTGNGVVDHTAIYIGNGYFVEASHNAGKVQTNYFSSWYRGRFICARRP